MEFCLLACSFRQCEATALDIRQGSSGKVLEGRGVCVTHRMPYAIFLSSVMVEDAVPSAVSKLDSPANPTSFST